MQLLLGIQIDEDECQIDFQRSDTFCGSSQMSVSKESYEVFCQRLSQKVRGLLSTREGIRPVTAIGVTVDGAVHRNTILESSALPFLVGRPFASDLSRGLDLGDIPIGIISNATAALLGSSSVFHNMRSVESAGALELAATLPLNR